jgi:hypothetical protein
MFLLAQLGERHVGLGASRKSDAVPPRRNPDESFVAIAIVGSLRPP